MTSRDLSLAASGEQKFTQGEMVELFGEEMPIEAAELVFGSAGNDMTIGEVRAKVRQMAATKSYAARLAEAHYAETHDLRVERPWSECHPAYREQKIGAMVRALDAVPQPPVQQTPATLPG